MSELPPGGSPTQRGEWECDNCFGALNRCGCGNAAGWYERALAVEREKRLKAEREGLHAVAEVAKDRDRERSAREAVEAVLPEGSRDSSLPLADRVTHLLTILRAEPARLQRRVAEEHAARVLAEDAREKAERERENWREAANQHREQRDTLRRELVEARARIKQLEGEWPRV